MIPTDQGGENGPAPGNLVSASWLAGLAVVDTEGRPVGEFVHVMLDVASGSIAFGVLTCESLLGSNDRLVAVPWNRLAFDARGRFFVLHLERERLRHAPQRDRGTWPLLADANFAAEMHAYYRMASERE